MTKACDVDGAPCELGPRFTPPAVLRDKVAAGLLGRKTGERFYRW